LTGSKSQVNKRRGILFLNSKIKYNFYNSKLNSKFKKKIKKIKKYIYI